MLEHNDGAWLKELADELRPAIEESVAAQLFDEHGEIRTVERELRKEIFRRTGVEV